MSDFFSETVKRLTPYIPGEQPKDGVYIKLNTNESPYPPSPNAISALKNADFEKLRLYPDPECVSLRNTYANYLGVSSENVFVGNGSDEVLATAFQTFFAGKNNVLMPNISYSFYPVYCNLYNVRATEIPLKDWRVVCDDYCVANNGVIIANPNAPTGVGVSCAEIENLLKNNPQSVVLIDEAYVDFGGQSAVGLVKDFDNVLVIRTLSKSYGLAGLRVGFAVGGKKLIEGMNTVKNSFNSYPVDFLAQLAAEEAIKDVDYLNQTTSKIIATRERTALRLKNLGFNVLDSSANFLFIIHKEIDAGFLFNYLKQNKILVRWFSDPKIKNGLRISIGTDFDMEKFCDIIANALEAFR
ncbi:MAG: histidinol-phosphate transaminase [Clostridiales bacterium]|jgi:histidinol-phosphate aminotransferase|nr:histidinol-phosphate transaminase [Clostridiales bacterium]